MLAVRQSRQDAGGLSRSASRQDQDLRLGRAVRGREAAWAYTIGMHDRGSPEFLVTGLSPARALWLLNTFAKRIVRTQRVPVPGERISLPAGTRVEVVEVPHPDAHMGIAVDIHRRPFRAMQLVWADDRGRWPWSADFDDGRGSQPVVGARAQKA